MGIWASQKFATTTWASRGTGVAGQIKFVNDIGMRTGASTYAGALMISDGTNWRALGGYLPITQQNGSIATPLATISASTAALFTLPVAISLPGGIIAPHSRVAVTVWGRRTGTAATASLDVTIGTAGTAADTLLGRVTYGATNNQNALMEAQGKFGANPLLVTVQGTQTVQTVNTNATFADSSTNINTAQAMSMTIGISSGNASDSFTLIGYAVVIYY